jgi:hypothetical protein
MRAIAKLAHVDLNWISHEEGTAPVGKRGETFKGLPVQVAPQTKIRSVGVLSRDAHDELARRKELSGKLFDLFGKVARLNTDQQYQIVLALEDKLETYEKSFETMTKQPS